jgi:hypothetical protein
MEDSFEMLRSERRSFFCPNKLWQELLDQTEDCMSVSSYIKMAILEKMIKDEPEKEPYFRELME